jgi:hypothetical protein
VEEELIVEIHRTSIWPVVVTVESNINTTKETDFENRDSCYIVLIPDGTYESFDVVLGRGKFKKF